LKSECRLRRPKKEKNMAKLTVGDIFPSATLKDIDGVTVDFPPVFKNAPATVVFFYRGRW
jgi:peroxiredoxin